MTQLTGIPRTFTKTLALTGTGVLALALLTGCSVADEGTPDDGGGASATESGSTAGSSPATADDATDDASDASGSSTPSGTSSAGGGTTPAASDEDPVFSAIDALLAENSDAVIVQIDQDDDDTTFEIEAVIGDRVVDFDITTDGSVREDDDDDDDDDDDNDDIRRAGEAQVTAEEAARAALEGREGQSIDEMELDEDNGTLRWEVSLDREGGDDGDELRVDATTGEVTQDG